MGEPFLGEIRIVSFNFPPKGWAFCNGQLLPINQNQALFSLFGTMYGGNGQTNFALPNLQGRVPIHTDNSNYTLGQAGGEEAHTINQSEMPAHNHFVSASSAAPNAGSPAGNVFAANASGYSNAADSAMAVQTVSNVGGSQAHSNMQPYLVLNFIVALIGIFPTHY